VVRGAFYHWIDDELAALMEHLLDAAVEYAGAQPVHLPGLLGTVDDWWVIDSETVTLRDALSGTYPGSGSAAAVKVHKTLSLGRGCMVGYHFSPAREHDSPHLDVDASFAGKGILVDLGYASRRLIRSCDRHDVKYVIRLKDNWRPRVNRIVRGELSGDWLPGTDLDILLDEEVIALDGNCVDADVTIGEGKHAVRARLVAIPGPKTYLFYLTNLSRSTHGPLQVGELYRARWEIECDNKLDKSTGRLDQVRATTDSSVRVLLCATLLHSLLADLLVHKDIVERAHHELKTRPPLHRLLVAHALKDQQLPLLAALMDSSTQMSRWDKIARTICQHGHDPNWRRRPSILDRLRGIVAPGGRPRRSKLANCPPSAAPYRSAPIPAAVS